MDCQWCYRQHLNSVNDYTMLGLGDKLAETISSLDVMSSSFICRK